MEEQIGDVDEGYKSVEASGRLLKLFKELVKVGRSKGVKDSEEEVSNEVVLKEVIEEGMEAISV